MLKKILSYTLPLILGISLAWWVFRGQNMAAIAEGFAQLNYFWVCATIICCVAGHLSRAVRWRMLLQPLGYHISIINAFWAVMINYIANIALPRAGEVSRCAAIYKTDGVPVATSLGTVVTDRIIDMVCFGITLVLALALNFDFFRQPFIDATSKITSIYTLLGLGIGCVGAAWGVHRFFIVNKEKLLKNGIIKKIYNFIYQLIQGVASIKNLRSPVAFVAHSVVIWASYWACMYCMMQSYPPTAMLSATDALVLLVLGSLGFIVPVQGGIGAYHAAVSWGLLQLMPYYTAHKPQILYTINTQQALTFATVAHGILTLVVVVLGLVALVAVFLLHKNKSK